MEAIRTSETLVYTISARRHILEEGILRWIIGFARWVFRLKPIRCLSVGLHEVESYHGVKAEARHQLGEDIDETAACMRNECGCMQCQHSVAQGLSACM
jgi:hypothetical protein